MKNYLQLFIMVAIVLLLMSCEKQEEVVLNDTVTDVSNSMAQNDGKFKKEIAVTDESGKNTAFYAIYSDDKNLLSEYLKAYKFSLKINEENLETLKSCDLTDKGQLKSGIEDFDLNQEPKIIVELVTTNLQDNVVSYSLETQKNELKSATFIYGYPVGYTTTNDFIGAVHKGYGYEFLTKFGYKNHWYSLWTDFEINGQNAWFVYPSSEYYISLGENYNFYKRRMTIYPHYYQYNDVNWTVAYIRNDFRGHFCQIGTYDPYPSECYVGTAPEGTTAFYWGPNSNELNFYYTPINGNQCPRPGSSFDGANCFVMDIPAGVEPYIWNQNWLTKPDILDN